MPKADGRRDNVPAEFEQVLRTGSLPQSSLRDASSLQQSRAACSPRPARAKPLVSSAALPELCFAKSPVRTIRWSRNWFAWERETWYDILLYFGMSFGVLIPNGNAKQKLVRWLAGS